MRVIRIAGAKDGSLTKITRLTADGSNAARNDFLRLVNVLRYREPVESNWMTADGFWLQTKDGYLFNVKD